MTVVQSGFVEVVPKAKETLPVMELYFTNGNRLAFYSKPDPILVKALVR